jgi:uncharacterized protein with PQ loop repeat
MSLAPLLQVRVIVRERDSRGTSLGWVLILLVGFVLWLAYGVVNRDLPITITNVVAVVVTSTLVIARRIYGRRPRESLPDLLGHIPADVGQDHVKGQPSASGRTTSQGRLMRVGALGRLRAIASQRGKMRTNLLSVLSVVAGSSVLAALALAPAAQAATDPMSVSNPVAAVGTVDTKYVDGRVETSAPLWTASIPTVGWITPSADKCREIVITVAPTVGLDTLTDLDVDFELWTANGQEIASDSIYSSSWNPSGGPTQAALFDCDYVVGDYTLYVTTQYELSTNGLISRYVEGKQQVPFSIKATPLCAKKPKLNAVEYVAAAACSQGWVPVKKACAIQKGSKTLYLGVKKGRCPSGWQDIT